jgi:hypothetical protein
VAEFSPYGNNKMVVFSTTLLLLYFLSVFFLPRIGGDGGHFRYEDVLTPFLCVALIFSLKKKYLFIYTVGLSYCFYIVFFGILNIAFERSGAYSIFIIGKEIQYYVVFFLSLNLLSNIDIYKVFNLFLFPVLFLIFIFTIISIVNNNVGAYGLQYINEKSPSLSAIMYFNCMFLSLVMFFYYKRINEKKSNISIVFFITFLTGTAATASRTALLVLMFFLILYALLFLKPKVKIIIFSILSAAFFLIYLNRYEIHEYISNNKPSGLILHMMYGRFNSLLLMFDSFDVIQGARLNSWSIALSKIDYANIIFGQGRGYFSATDGAKGLGTDSQYTRNIVEIGSVGFLLFFAMIFASFRHLKGRWRRMYFVYLFSYILWGAAAEIFLLTKGAQMFWLSTSILIALSKPVTPRYFKNIYKSEFKASAT